MTVKYTLHLYNKITESEPGQSETEGEAGRRKRKSQEMYHNRVIELIATVLLKLQQSTMEQSIRKKKQKSHLQWDD